MELIYFPLKGRGETARLIMVDHGVKYTETNCANNWMTEWKPKMSFVNMLDLYTDLYGDCEKEACRADIVNDSVEDLRSGYVNLIYRNYEAGKEEYIKGLPAKFGYFENFIKDTKPYILGDKICFADYSLFDVLDIHLILAPSCLDGFSALQAFYKAVGSRPKIKAYRETDAVKAMPVNGNNKQ
ncbi:glutathione S-transferase P 1-like [Argopecten irradians]|uniref:glutathione S-transferase P 1-like n=1 Tax=Argopecten irradians TaxID=31199 RepID=UPI00371E6BBE